MCIKPVKQSAFTLVETMAASCLSLMLATVIAAFAYFSSRSFVTMANYTDMNQRSQLAMDKMAKDIRQARRLIAYKTNSVTFLDADTNAFTFAYSAASRNLVRVGYDGKTNVYLTDCNSLKFSIYQHTMKSNMFVCYDSANITNARVIQVNWNCSRDIRGKKATTENVQTAEIVMRNH